MTPQNPRFKGRERGPEGRERGEKGEGEGKDCERGGREGKWGSPNHYVRLTVALRIVDIGLCRQDNKKHESSGSNNITFTINGICSANLYTL